MVKTIISIFSLILLLSGCQDRSSLEKLAQKMKNKATNIVQTKEQNQTAVEQNQTVTEENQTVAEEKENKEEVPIAPKLTNLTLQTLSHDSIKLKFQEEGIEFEKYKNKIVILDIFTTWCPPCMAVFPHLVDIQKKYKKDVQFIGLLMEEGRRDSEILEFKKKHKLNYPITNSKENFTLVNTWGGVSGYPTIIIFDKNGTYFNHFNGAAPQEMLEADIKKVLKLK